MSSIVQLSNVRKVFNQTVAVDGLSLNVEKGDIYGFLGPNGSGKSTSLRMITGLISPTSGDISLFGLPIHSHRKEIMSRIGCIIEKPDFYGYLSAKENISLFVRASGMSYTTSQYNDLFDWVGLKGRENDKVKTYSHGMKQRLGLAQALLHNPDLILLDEPNTGLDPQGIIDLRHLIVKLNKEKGTTILFSSHILSEVQEICTRMIVIHKGKSIVEGNLADLLSQDDMYVQLELSNLDQDLTLFQQSNYASKLSKIEEGMLILKMGKAEIPDLISSLVQLGIGILRVDYRNQLEDYFLKITNQ